MAVIQTFTVRFGRSYFRLTDRTSRYYRMDLDVDIGIVYPAHGHGPTQRRRTDYGHPAHRGFARAIEATDIIVPFRQLPEPLQDTLATDVLSAALASIPKQDVYLTENDAVLYAAPFLRRRHPEATIVHLATSDRLLGSVYVRRATDTPFQRFKRRVNSRVDNALLQRVLTRYCDGSITVSDFGRERIRSFGGPSFPVRVATPYIQPEQYSSLERNEPDLGSKVAVTVGEWRDHKGVDMLVDAWSEVRKHHPTAELRILGRGYPSEYADTLGVTLRGFVDSVDADFADASLYVHPSYIEAFGVSVVEAMRSGLPAIVTETTGAKSVVAEVDDSLVVPPSSKALATAVVRYFDSDAGYREAVSRASREQSEPFTKEVKTQFFCRQLCRLLDEIESRS